MLAFLCLAESGVIYIQVRYAMYFIYTVHEIHIKCVFLFSPQRRSMLDTYWSKGADYVL